jgi:argininosuccinate lyase
MPFREAHDRIARLVARLAEEGRRISDLSPADLGDLDPDLTPEGLELLIDPWEAARRRRSRGGSAPEEQDRQLALLRGMLDMGPADP